MPLVVPDVDTAPPVSGLVALVFERIGTGQVSERITDFSTDQGPRLENEIGDLPIGSRALRVQSSDCDVLDFGTAEGPVGKLQAFRLKPLPALGRHLLQLSVLCHRFLPMSRRCRRCNALAMPVLFTAGYYRSRTAEG
jgi:hypothetical protein